jgi:transcriptional regulator with XRE-family HTH domain
MSIEKIKLFWYNQKMSKVFGNNLKLLRLEKKLSQEELAQELQVSRQIIGHWENNYSEPDIDTLYQIAEYFGVSVDYLIGRDNKK